jgi:cbb3-type cytochrome oxidase subunit 1
VTSLVRRFIKTAIAFLLGGLAIGAWMMIRRELSGRFAGPYETSAHTHAILVGFVMMMIQGVALWLFPRPEKGDMRYRPALIETAYWCLTLGTATRVVGELARLALVDARLGWLILFGGMLQIGGLAVFFIGMWPRIRAAGSRVREASGERF